MTTIATIGPRGSHAWQAAQLYDQEADIAVFSRPAKVVEAIRGGAAGCWTLDNKPQRLFAGNRQPGFKAAMQAKDMHIVMDSAEQFGMPLPATTVTTQLFDQMLDMGLKDQDNSAVVAVIEKQAGTPLLAD